jgi:hypothetical protein
MPQYPVKSVAGLVPFSHPGSQHFVSTKGGTITGDLTVTGKITSPKLDEVTVEVSRLDRIITALRRLVGG